MSFMLGPPVCSIELAFYPDMGCAACPGLVWVAREDPALFSTLCPSRIAHVAIQADVQKSMCIELHDGQVCRLRLSSAPSHRKFSAH